MGKRSLLASRHSTAGEGTLSRAIADEKKEQGAVGEPPATPQPGDARCCQVGMLERGLVVVKKNDDTNIEWAGCLFCPAFGARGRRRNYVMIYKGPLSDVQCERHLKHSHPEKWTEYSELLHGTAESRVKFWMSGNDFPSMSVFEIAMIKAGGPSCYDLAASPLSVRSEQVGIPQKRLGWMLECFGLVAIELGKAGGIVWSACKFCSVFGCQDAPAALFNYTTVLKCVILVNRNKCLRSVSAQSQGLRSN